MFQTMSFNNLKITAH